MNKNFTDKELLAECCKLLEHNQDAVRFILAYGEYIEHIDDLVDEEKDNNRNRKLLEYSSMVFNSNYWCKYRSQLYLLERMIHNTYFDSVTWETSTDEWKRRDAKCLSHCGYMMLFAVVLIECGEEALNGFTLRFREHAHLRHINDKI